MSYVVAQQNTEEDCGAACLATLAKHFGYGEPSPTNRLRWAASGGMRMQIRTTTLATISLSLFIFAPGTLAQPYRTIDGTGNNIANPDWGAAGIHLRRRMDEDYADLISAMRVGVNPRVISNEVAAQAGPIYSSGGESDYIWQWGQFLDHDIDLTPMTTDELANIPIPPDDEFFPTGSGMGMGMGGGNFIPFTRSIYDLATGTGAGSGMGMGMGGVPRQQLNVITSYIDASNVYGSDSTLASELRTNDGTGRLLTSVGDLLPLDGGMFLGGDARANEQIGLTAMHTLFMREHNRLAELIAQQSPGLPGDEIYQRARRVVGALMQKITYDEFLPALLGRGALRGYRGYDPSVNASIMNVFSTAAYRFGHSMLSPTLLRLDSDGDEIPGGHVPLRLAFNAPKWILDDGIEPLLRGLATQRAQNVDVTVVDDVRNFLFGSPAGAVGLDLASLNIQRARDHGIPPYNAARVAMGLAPALSFADVSSDPVVQANLAAVYPTVDGIDAWVGGLAEDHVRGALVGELNFTVIKEQFEALRDGDRFWYQRPGVLSGAERGMVVGTTLKDVIVRNTVIEDAELQEDVFHVN